MESNPGISLFQGGSINVENPLQNQEEQEDLEDQERRKQEIQSLLTKAMDEFNYDDQSTINSSTNVSIDDYRSKFPETTSDYHYEQKYKEASIDDQLKVLYEVRVREVQTLSEQVELLKAQLSEQKDGMMKNLMLQEAEKERAQLSLRQSQELLIVKTEENSKLLKEIDNCKTTVQNLQAEMQTISREHDSLKSTNRDLMEQLTIMQNGLSENTVSDRQLQEAHHAELTKLRYTLDNALTRLEKKDGELKEMEQVLNKKIQEKDEIMAEKSGIINKLTCNLEGAQQQCRELLELVEEVSQENMKLKRNATNFDYANSLQSTLTDKSEIIKVLQKELDKVNDTHTKQLIDYENLHKTYLELRMEYEAKVNEVEAVKIQNCALEKANYALETRIKTQFDEIGKLNERLDKCLNVYNENEILEKRINSLQILLSEFENRNTKEHSVQVSQIMTSFCEQNDLHKEEIEKLERQLEECRNNLSDANQKISEYEDDIKRLQTKVSLEKERDQLIQTLQEKAVQFQKVILERQESPRCNNVAVNTDNIEDTIEILKAQYETELIEKEIQIRLEIQKEYDLKTSKSPEPCKNCPRLSEQLTNLETRSNYKSPESCKNCPQLTEQLKNLESALKTSTGEYESMRIKLAAQLVCSDCGDFKKQLLGNKEELEKQSAFIERLKEQQVQDRETIVKILEDWKLKFNDLERGKQALIGQLVDSQKNCSELEAKLRLREQGDVKLVEDLQKETMILMKQWNKQAMESVQKITTAQMTKILESRQRIDNISKKADKKVKEIELRYKKSRAAIEQTIP